MPAPFRHVVVIGASAGGVNALLEIARQLPRSFPAPVCIVQHIGSNVSLLPELLRSRGGNHAMHAEDGQRLTTGTLHIAPPDHHMLLEGDTLRLTHGPRENHARPAIDPLFRTAALSCGTRVIGVILSGHLDDGSAGLKAVHDCGGVTIVQDPDSAEEPEMPRSALAATAVDHCVPTSGLVPLLQSLVGDAGARRAAPPIPEQIIREVAINRGEATVENIAAIGEPSPLTCPDCGGGLWELKDRSPLRYRCHTGHAYTSLSLRHAQQESAEHALFSSARALRERELLLRRVAAVAAASGDQAQAAAGIAQADRLQEQVRAIIRIAQSTPSTADEDATP